MSTTQHWNKNVQSAYSSKFRAKQTWNFGGECYVMTMTYCVVIPLLCFCMYVCIMICLLLCVHKVSCLSRV